MKIYRGCKETGLKTMEPKLVNHGNSFVYGTTDKIEAIIYSVKGGNLNYTNIYGYDDDGSRCLIERKTNCLEEIFNKEGRYYILDDKDFIKHEKIGVGDNEYVSTKPVKVLEEIIIPNVWEYFKQLEKSGNFKIYRYPSRPKIYPDDDSDLIDCALLTYYQIGNIDMAFGLLEKYHPEMSERINNIKNKIKDMSKDELDEYIKKGNFFN